MFKKIFLFALMGISILSFDSCDKGPSQEEIDQELIEAYILENNLNTTKTESGLHYIIYDEGDDNHPDYYSFIIARYKGYLLDGTVFDDGSQELNVQLAQMIPGWIEGLQLIGEGGEMLLIIPSNLGYGGIAKAKIPEYSVLVFELKLLQVYDKK
ncbi:MAG: peptidylprolyl isomerase [Marinilabiliales bacterium]|nr:MAG: peptidylprolyl isomerase [Marinilabiliales bacterium]